jgi:hypothetical protein
MHSWCVCSRWNGFSPPASKLYAFSSTTTACDTRPITALRLRTRLSIECCPRVRHHGTTPPRGGCVPLCGRGNLAHPRHCVNAVLECRQRAYDGGVFRRPRRRAVALRVRSQHLAMAPRPAAGRSRVIAKHAPNRGVPFAFGLVCAIGRADMDLSSPAHACNSHSGRIGPGLGSSRARDVYLAWL